MAVRTQAGKPAFDTLTTESRTYNIDGNIVIGTPVQFVTGKEYFVEPYTTGKFAGIVCHTDDNSYDETTNLKTIEGPTTVKVMHKGNMWVKVDSNVTQGAQLFVGATGKFGNAGTKLNGHYDSTAASGEEAIIVLDNINTI